MTCWTWIQHFRPKSDQQLKWHSTSCCRMEYINCVPSAGSHDYSHVGWEGLSVMNAFPKGATVNSFCCNETTGSLNACLCPLSVSQKKNVRSVCPLWHTRPRTNLHTTEVIILFVCCCHTCALVLISYHQIFTFDPSVFNMQSHHYMCYKLLLA
jgi:hypothetical protein